MSYRHYAPAMTFDELQELARALAPRLLDCVPWTQNDEGIEGWLIENVRVRTTIIRRTAGVNRDLELLREHDELWILISGHFAVYRVTMSQVFGGQPSRVAEVRSLDEEFARRLDGDEYSDEREEGGGHQLGNHASDYDRQALRSRHATRATKEWYRLKPTDEQPPFHRVASVLDGIRAQLP